MSTPTPFRSFIGGLGLSFPVHALLLLNGNVFGISGFFHRAVQGNLEALAGISGLIAGGLVIGTLEGTDRTGLGLEMRQVLLSGFLVGLGTKLSNGCTSGHMICGISRLSKRSIAATVTFFSTVAVTARLLHGSMLGASNASWDWTLGPTGQNLIALQSIPSIISTLLYFYNSNDTAPKGPHILARRATYFTTGFSFALALSLSNLTDPIKVLTFLLLPIHSAFDSSLAFLALGALPTSIILYTFFRGTQRPILGGSWAIPTGGEIDLKLLTGAGLFGAGWGISGICPGPGLVNFGRDITSGSDFWPLVGWLSAVAVGGILG
ncbi:uncharacterized protein BT62DRAFT_891089 [Guyanagaster necrorhizus]|uniref:Sulphur transport domain-containing protein n=1 Tax=Guyanagaster necrorhizus TaxID=856835 RepID=A0A9P8ATZ0_9AGAR|nr:uncharacterized protein BT62DRAFT_891089 [Guyanagaster necrorhizus MCA 3950]KAG7447933.1 hypothetical protein BT62DRAFT_891089 [Guyanagaster necrorhizus MCA 3950]